MSLQQAEEDAVDYGDLEEFVEDTAQEVVVAAEDVKDGAEGVLLNSDGDPCKSYEWSILFLLIFVISMLLMMAHMWTLFKRRSMLSCIDVLTVALFAATVIQFGPMLSQVRMFATDDDDAGILFALRKFG